VKPKFPVNLETEKFLAPYSRLTIDDSRLKNKTSKNEQRNYKQAAGLFAMVQ
jgi:hypothetical protein